MASFFSELWESVFQPGTNPALIKATHGSFVLLILSLLSLIYITRSIHFVNLLVIACILYGIVVWFIGELQQAKLNQQLEDEQKKKENENEDAAVENKADEATIDAATSTTTTGLNITVSNPTSKSRKA